MTPQEMKDKADALRLANAPKPPSADIEGSPTESETLFHNQHPGSSFYMPNGDAVVFDYKGELRTKDPRVIAELKAIADRPGCPVYFKNNGVVPAPGDQEAARDNLKNAESVMNALRAQQAAGKPQ